MCNSGEVPAGRRKAPHSAAALTGKRPVKAWTDYPLTELGDIEHREAPIRECEVISYDKDKYVTVRVGSITASIKSGYCYMEKGRCGEVPALNRRVLMSLPETQY